MQKQFNNDFIRSLTNKYNDINETMLLEYYSNLHPNSVQWFFEPAGTEHYRLLAFISSNYSGALILDIGTNTGSSALALSKGSSNHVISYDIEDCREGHGVGERIEHKIGLATDDIANIQNASVIFLDTKHDGTFEDEFRNKLIELNWKGVLLLDDIYLNPEMKAFWDSITQEKIDLTKVGHWSGTGAVIFE